MTIVADIWNMIEGNKKWQTLKETVERIPELEARISSRSDDDMRKDILGYFVI